MAQAKGAAQQLLKTTTGLTGLKVSKTPHHTLGVLYNRILKTLEKMPATAAYRIHTQKVVEERCQSLASSTDTSDVERKINCGQVEELIVQAENELILARKFLVWKPWEPLLKNAPANQWTWPPTAS